MCVVCILFNKGLLKPREAKRALWEVVKDAKNDQEEQHLKEVYSEMERLDKENDKTY